MLYIPLTVYFSSLSIFQHLAFHSIYGLGALSLIKPIEDKVSEKWKCFEIFWGNSLSTHPYHLRVGGRGMGLSL